MVAEGGDAQVNAQEILHDLHVRDQAGTRENPLEEVVAKEGGLGHSAGHRRFKGVYVVDALARIAAPRPNRSWYTVRNRGGIGVDADHALENTRRNSEPSRPTGRAGVTRGCRMP